MSKFPSVALVSYGLLLLIVVRTSPEPLCISSIIHYILLTVSAFLVNCGSFGLKEVVMIVVGSLVFVH